MEKGKVIFFFFFCNRKKRREKNTFGISISGIRFDLTATNLRRAGLRFAFFHSSTIFLTVDRDLSVTFLLSYFRSWWPFSSLLFTFETWNYLSCLPYRRVYLRNLFIHSIYFQGPRTWSEPSGIRRVITNDKRKLVLNKTKNARINEASKNCLRTLRKRNA